MQTLWQYERKIFVVLINRTEETGRVLDRFLLPGVLQRRERDVSIRRDVQHTVLRLDPDAEQLDVLRRVGTHTRVILNTQKNISHVSRSKLPSTTSVVDSNNPVPHEV